jgi:hypothetical protein
VVGVDAAHGGELNPLVGLDRGAQLAVVLGGADSQ